MNGRSITKKILLWLTAATFFVAGILYFLEKNDNVASAQARYAKQVQSKVNKAIATSEAELQEITRLFQKSSDLRFSELSMNTRFPYFLYRNGKLAYWSDHRFVPEYSWIEGVYRYKLLIKNRHTQIVNKESFFHGDDKLELVSLIPVYINYENENEYLISGFDLDIFPSSPVTIKNTQEEKIYLNIHAPDKQFLFSIDPPRTGSLRTTGLPVHVLYLIAAGLLLSGVYLFLHFRSRDNSKDFELSTLLIIIYFGVLRWFMLANSLPFVFWESDLFNPRFFAHNVWTPSLGDLIVNTLIIVLIIAYIVSYFQRSALFRFMIKSGTPVKSPASVLTLVVSSVITCFSCYSLKLLYTKSSYYLDISFSTQLDSLTLAIILYYVLLAILFFISHHILISVFYRLNPDKKQGILHWIYGVLFSTFGLIFLKSLSWCYLPVYLYFLFSYLYKLPRYIYLLKYKTTIYLFLGAFVFSLISLHTLYFQKKEKAAFDKKTFGAQFLAENDLLGEGLMNRLISNISEDELVIQAMQRDLLAGQAVSALVKDQHLDIYFDKYETTVSVYDENGKPTRDDDAFTLIDQEARFKQKRFSTANPNIFFIDEASENILKEYAVFIPMGIENGTILVIFKAKNHVSKGVYPELLVDKHFTHNIDSKDYSYGIYDANSELLYSNGAFNYKKDFILNNFLNPDLYDKGILANNFEHVGLKSSNGKTIVVSCPNENIKTLLSDFSYIYMLLVLVIFITIFIYRFRYGLRRLRMSFSTKIQLYLNAAFLLPFLLILFVIIGAIRSTLLSIQENFFKENTENISSTVKLHLQELKAGKTSLAYFQQEIDKLANDTKTDINYYDLNGVLQYTTRPLIYEYDLLSDRINPKAYENIIEDYSNELMVNESLGDLKYRVVYMSIRNDSNERLGVVGVPFFDSSTMLGAQMRKVLTTILSVCTFLFIILLITSYFVSGQLTQPLSLVAQRIKKLSLNDKNEPILWEGDDEIGVLTKSYNDMLGKLADSRDALSQSEKQNAWREMARQVVHEIKNPLTPMKLSIQQLQRTLPSLDEKTRQRLERSLNSLTEQIDNISEIANSFSEFAKMPVPRSEIFDVVSLVQKTAYLYAQNNELDFSFQSDDEVLYVRSDHQMINRVVTNLIINGMQSVPVNQKPRIDIRISRSDKDKFAIIEVKDNGSGIPEEYRSRIFMPNFSTKVGGSGLGLAMAKRGVEHSGGNIWFETTTGQGTSFYVDLPLAKPS
jgi:two-component system nitrogen regulation sensor histidine kinase NtrY